MPNHEFAVSAVKVSLGTSAQLYVLSFSPFSFHHSKFDVERSTFASFLGT
jgi:hypothetical protein